MIKIRAANTRGHLQRDWTESWRTFSNNSYWDPRYMNWNSIKVINDDTLQPGAKIPEHGHANIEVLTYIISGELQHWDSKTLTTSNVTVGTMQHMTCGSGISHTEENIGQIPAHYVQIWVTPRDQNRTPAYETINISPTFSQITVDVNQNVAIYAGTITTNVVISESNSYVYVVDGNCSVNGNQLSVGDGADCSEAVTIVPETTANILVFAI